MAIRTIRTMGDDVLRKKCKEVTEITKREITLINDMVDTMFEANGVGLAAVQVGILKRIVVIDLYEEGVEPYILINPEIIKTKGEQTVEEGCLSFPNKSPLYIIIQQSVLNISPLSNLTKNNLNLAL